MTYYCPACWARVTDTAQICPMCSADLTSLDRDPLDTKLVRALHHPDAETARRAARILGLRGTRRAVPALWARCRERSDPYLRAEIACALRRIGGPDAGAALTQLGADPSVVVRQAVAPATDR